MSGLLTTAVAVAACGGVENHLPDGDTGDDTAADAAPVGSITVTTYNRCCIDPGGLTAGVDVFVIEPDGSLGDRKTTNGTGMVTLENVPGGSSVTAIYPESGGSIDRVTVVAVQPGDNLVFGETVHQAAGVAGQMLVTVPAYPDAYYYTMSSPCGYGSMNATTGTLYFYAESGCDPSDIDVEVIVISNTTYLPISAAWLDNVNFVNGGELVVSGWAAVPTLQLRATNVPAEVEYVYLYAEQAFTHGSSYYPAYRASIWGVPVDGTLAGSTTWGQGGAEAIGTMSMYRAGDVGSQEFYARFAGTAASWAAEPAPLPWLGDAYISAASREIAFAKLGDEAYDAAVVQSYWYDDTPFFGKGGTNNNWTVILPPGMTQFSWANAPASIAGFLPTDVDTLSGSLMLVDFPNADGYDGLRGLDEATVSCPSCAMRTGSIDGQIGVAYGRGGEGFAPARSRP